MLPEPDTHTWVPRLSCECCTCSCGPLPSSLFLEHEEEWRSEATCSGQNPRRLIEYVGETQRWPHESACTAGWTLLAPSMCSPVRAAKTIMRLNLSNLGWCLNHDFIFPLSALLGKIWRSQFPVVVSRRTGRRYWDLLECGPADSLDAACTEWRIQNTVMAFAASEKC